MDVLVTVYDKFAKETQQVTQVVQICHIYYFLAHD